MDRIGSRNWRLLSAGGLTLAVCGFFLTSAAQAQAGASGPIDWVNYDLTSQQTDPQILPDDNRLGNLNRYGVQTATSRPDSGADIRIDILRPSSGPLDADGRARSLVGTGSLAPGEFDDETVTALDIQLGGRDGLNLTSSFGLSSQPRQPNPGDIFFLRGNEVREDRATARIGIRF